MFSSDEAFKPSDTDFLDLTERAYKEEHTKTLKHTRFVSPFLKDNQQRVTAKMKLYLAVAVLMLAFVAYTEAQEETIEQRFATFRDQMAEMSKNLAEKAKTTFEQFQTSDLAVNSQNWFREQYESLKAKVGEIGQ
ncbi:hypothetical protein PFLUV_G00087570 [Perca fluviatilis]|uniref:Apolipoprotein C-IV n=2 Tax=Perca fluviatilis TaxID=8168 RepID=A0A6A5FEI1_PERFL|nr:hypothetical protein PFLUV_G00087570 [Perca fluviatilis]